MRKILAVAILAELGAGSLQSNKPLPVPVERPWMALFHDAGLAGGSTHGLVFALWRDGTLVRQRDARSRSDGRVRIGHVDATAIQSVERTIEASGLRTRPTAPRALDLSEDGLVIRSGSTTKCWFDTPPTAMTPGLKRVAEAILRLSARDERAVTVPFGESLPWAHYHEPGCQ